MDIRFVIQVMLIVLILTLSGLIVTGIIRREKSKRRVRRMAMPQKIQILNELAEPFGFFCIPKKDIFTSDLYAWQRKRGYEELFDRAAAGLNMVIDAFPVYFDYEGRTWLIEFWKGQYGINTGGEVGVYRAKEIVPKIFYKAAHFDAVPDEEMPEISCRLERKKEELYRIKAYHWWLTGFRMGVFSKPEDLSMMTKITFRNTELAQAFYEGLKNTRKPESKYEICQNEVCVRMDFSIKVSFVSRIHRRLVQWQNRFNCWLFRGVTHPFTHTADRMLFLYYQVPFAFRRMLRLKRIRRPVFCHRRKGKCR